MASNLGRIRGQRGWILTPVLTQYGYHQVSVCQDGKKLARLVHRLVAYAFIGPPPSPEYDVLHYDGDKTNNALVNLRWATPKENSADQVRHGTTIRGEKSPHSKLTDKDVQIIRYLYDAGYTVKDISVMYPVAYEIVWAVAKRRKWTHVPEIERHRADIAMLENAA
jgi:hypothetical protein